MKPLHSLALKVEGGKLWVLDQTRLPDVESWLEGDDPGVMVGHIQRLSVRGAPLIGVAAALCFARFAESGAAKSALEDAFQKLRRARPTAVNLMWAMDRMNAVLNEGGSVPDLTRVAEAIFDEDVALCEAMAARGAALFSPGEAVLTHCNAGALATAGIGTAVGVIRRAFELGKVSHVFVDETRPLLQGARLTAWEMVRAGIPHTLITDSMAAILMRDGSIQRVLVGADRVAANGDFANKVGTYGVAVQAAHHGVPFHPVAPWSTVDLACANGAAIPIEERAAAEVRGFGALRWAPESSPVFNPSFDVTPAALVTSLVLDRAVLSQAQLNAGMLSRL
ncbi:MAG: S-methyl-5-thioribose-1-phosphate isomerase [Holophaga sp.]